MDAAERTLAAGVLSFPSVVQEAAATYDPSLIANHCYDLIKAFSSFYQDHPIAKEQGDNVRQLRLALCAAVSTTVSNGMSLLGIDMPERM
jgi:arginyl-tRNA synthetase